MWLAVLQFIPSLNRESTHGVHVSNVEVLMLVPIIIILCVVVGFAVGSFMN